jgi:hypothetical protein
VSILSINGGSKKGFNLGDRVIYLPRSVNPRRGEITDKSLSGMGAYQVHFDGHTVGQLVLEEYLMHEQEGQ